MSAFMDKVVDSTQDFNKRIESLKSLIGEQKEQKVSEGTTNTKNTMAAILLELTTIAGQLAHVEKTMALVNEGIPEEEEAKRFYEISVQALQTSRNMLAEKQLNCLKDLSALTGATPKTEPAAPQKDTEQKAEAPSTWDSWTPTDISGCPEFVPPPPGLAPVQSYGAAGASTGSLRGDLEILRHAQPETVLIVRKIKKLGFESPEMLKQHFAQYGRVSEILVAHSHVKATAKRPNGRVRPAALGFVIMGSAEGAQKAFEAGVTQMVSGCPIELGPFESFDNHYGSEEGAADES